MPTLHTDLNTCKTFNWYLSALLGMPQDIETNAQFARNFASLIRNTLSKPPHNMKHIIALHEMEHVPMHDNKASLCLDLELELVGRGELSPIYRSNHNERESLAERERLASLVKSKAWVDYQIKPINPTLLKSLYPYFILLMLSEGLMEQKKSKNYPPISESLNQQVLIELERHNKTNEFYEKASRQVDLRQIVFQLREIIGEMEAIRLRALIRDDRSKTKLEGEPQKSEHQQTFFAQKSQVKETENPEPLPPSMMKRLLDMLIAFFKKIYQVIRDFCATLCGCDTTTETMKMNKS